MSVLKLLTLNTWGRTGPWAQRRALIADGIRALDPHVVALQEVWQDGANSAQEIADAIGGEWHLHYGAAWDTGERTEGNAVLSRFPITDSAVWPLPEPRHDHERNLAYAVVATPWGQLPVFVTHLSWMMHQSSARLMQLQQVREWMKERAPIQKGDAPTDLLPPVLMGDLNAEPVSDEIRFLHGYLADGYGFYLADCFARCGDGPGHTWHRSNAYAAREPHPDRRLDYILVRGPDRWRRGEPLAARVVLDQPRDGVFASDHFGVYAELRATPYTVAGP
jgi:endonuclease/exonuclease/phosphatase family metal-dependent hydrolase